MAEIVGIGGTSPLSFGTATTANNPFNPFSLPQVHDLGFVEPHEQEEAQAFIDKMFIELCGKTLREHAHFTRYFAVVKIYIRPEELKEITDADGKKQKLYLPDMVRAEDRYQSCTGLVVALGPQAFQDKEGRPRGCRYRVGDWLLFPRTDIIRVDFNGVALGVMPDDRAIAVVTAPEDWMQGSTTFKS